MTRRKIWLPVALSLVLILLCAAVLPSANMIISSFPEILLGQVVLARETKPLSASAYQSTEFVLNRVTTSEIKKAVFIALSDDVLLWDPQYVGFRRTELSEHEIRAIQQLLSAGHLFYQKPDSNIIQCVTNGPVQEPILTPCADGKHYMDQYKAYQWGAEQNHAVGVLQFFLTGWRLAEIRIYPSEQGLAYSPHEISGDWWLNGVTASSPLLDELSARVNLPSISVLWPGISASQANRRAARIMGSRYQLALETLQNSPAARSVFGDIQEIRPAAGNNFYSSWMDSTSVMLTLRVIGTRGEGAAIMQGYDCFNLQMVFQGVSVDAGSDYVCPGDLQRKEISSSIISKSAAVR